MAAKKKATKKKSPQKQTTTTVSAQSRVAKQKNEVLEIFETYPQIRVAAAKIGVHHSTVYRWFESDTRFAQKAEEARRIGYAAFDDLVESKLMQGINNDNASLIKYYLSRVHPRYKNDRDNVKTNVLSARRMNEIATAVKNWRKWLPGAVQESANTRALLEDSADE